MTIRGASVECRSSHSSSLNLENVKRLSSYLVNAFSGKSSKRLNFELCQLALEQGIGSALYELISPTLRSSVSWSIQEDKGLALLESDWMMRSAGYLARGAILQSVWPEESGPPLLIKGVDLEESVYPRIGLSGGSRACSDWDILLTSESHKAVCSKWREGARD